MAESLQDEIVSFEDYSEYNIAYPVIVTRWEIRQVYGLNKRYLQVYFQKLDNEVKAFQLNITSFSVFGKEVDNILERTIERVDEKEVEFSEIIPISNEAEKVEISVCQCLLFDGTAIKESTKRMAVNQFKPFEEEDRVAAQRLLPTAKGYPIDNGKQHWFCACGTLYCGDTEVCKKCKKSRYEILLSITPDRIEEEKKKEAERAQEQKNKKRKRIKLFSILGAVATAVVVLIGSLVGTLAPFNNVSYKDMSFRRNENGYTLTKYYRYADRLALEIPSKIRGKYVTEIGYGAFEDCRKLTSVTIPNSVTDIGNSAFSGCSGLTNVTIPNSITSIGENAFKDCTNLTRVTIGNGVTRIGKGAFSGCNELIQTENGVEYVDKWVIDCDTNASSVTLRQNTVGIACGAFEDCRKLMSIAIPNGMTSIGSKAFSNCSSLMSILIPDSVTFIGYQAFYSCSGLTSVTIPNSVTSIAVSTFSNCSSLMNVAIPNGVTSIGGWAFYGCDSLTSVLIPDSVTSIGNQAFYGCSSLKIYCAVESKPSEWDSYWNPNNRPVTWGYTGK